MEKKNRNVYKKLPGTSGLVTTTVLDTKIEERHNKISNPSVLVNKADYDAKILEIYCCTADYNKFTSDILDAKMKKKKKRIRE